MIKNEIITDLPEGFIESFNDISHRNFNEGMYFKFLHLSPEVRYFSVDGKPLLIVGTYTMSLLSDYTEMWMYATKYLRASHVREFRPWFYEWLSRQDRTVVARCTSPVADRFLRFMGFQYTKTVDGMKIYEVQPCKQ